MRAHAYRRAGAMTPDIEYHLNKLKILSDKGDPRRIDPAYRWGGWRVLDIGIGQSLVAEEPSEATELYGMDSDSGVIKCQVLTDREPRLRLVHAAAESLPFPGTYFDLVYSRVAMSYTNIPVAMSRCGSGSWSSTCVNPIRAPCHQFSSRNVEGKQH